MQPADRRHAERGFATLALVTVLMPLLIMVGIFLQTMAARQDRLQTEIHEEQALMTAEAGVDVALNEARRGLMVAGPGAEYVFSGALQNGSTYETVATYLGADGEDNDDDASVDEQDEDVFRLVSNGTYAGSERRVATYVGFVRYLPVLSGAMMLTNPRTTLTANGTPLVSGNNHLLNGSLAGSGNVFGVTMAPPGTMADLDGILAPNDPRHFVGATPTPSIGGSPFLDVPAITAFARQAASDVILNENARGSSFGTAASPVIAYREGDLNLTGETVGNGLLVVDGDLRIAGTFRWNGVIVCTGAFTAGAGTGDVFGAVILGPASPSARIAGTFDVSFSTEGIGLAASLLGTYVALGWQEVSTNG